MKVVAIFALFVAAHAGTQSTETRAQLKAEAHAAAQEVQAAMAEVWQAQGKMKNLNARISSSAQSEIKSGDAKVSQRGQARMAAVTQLQALQEDVAAHLKQLSQFKLMGESLAPTSFLQKSSVRRHRAPEDELAKEMTHDLEMNFNKIAPFGKEDTAKELQDHAAKTQDTLVDAVENAEVAEIKRAVFRALTRLRAATIKEFDTIARLETQAIDAYNDAHHYRAENPLSHLHEDEAPVETDKLKSFH